MKLIIYITDIFNPYCNLATEEYLCSSFDPTSEAILFLWKNKDTIVIGKNQNPYLQCNLEYVNQNNITVARRLSGGGSVYQDLGNLNYTLLSARDNFSIEKNFSIILDALCELDICAICSGRNDITVNNRKVSGTAFYYNANIAYQHGCILVNTDLEKMYHCLQIKNDKIIGKAIESVKTRTINLSDINPSITTECLEHYIIQYASKHFEKSEVRPIKDIYNDNIYKALFEKYSSFEWNMGNHIEMKMDLYRRFLWGDCSIFFEIESGIIKKAGIYTDSLETEVFGRIEEALRGVLFKKEKILNRINNIQMNENECKMICEDVCNLIKAELNTL